MPDRRSKIASPPAPSLPGYPVAQVIRDARPWADNPYPPSSPRATVWLMGKLLVEQLGITAWLLAVCPECGQLLSLPAGQSLITCGFCGGDSSVPAGFNATEVKTR